MAVNVTESVLLEPSEGELAKSCKLAALALPLPLPLLPVVVEVVPGVLNESPPQPTNMLANMSRLRNATYLESDPSDDFFPELSIFVCCRLKYVAMRSTIRMLFELMLIFANPKVCMSH